MILPTKRVGEDRALLTLGARILQWLDEPKTVSRLWDEIQRERTSQERSGLVTFDWFVLALDMLFALGVVSLRQGRIYVVAH